MIARYMNIAPRAFSPGSIVSGVDWSFDAEVYEKYEISINPTDEVNVVIDVILRKVWIEQLSINDNAKTTIPTGVIR